MAAECRNVGAAGQCYNICTLHPFGNGILLAKSRRRRKTRKLRCLLIYLLLSLSSRLNQRNGAKPCSSRRRFMRFPVEHWSYQFECSMLKDYSCLRKSDRRTSEFVIYCAALFRCGIPNLKHQIAPVRWKATISNQHLVSTTLGSRLVSCSAHLRGALSHDRIG